MTNDEARALVRTIAWIVGGLTVVGLLAEFTR